MGRSRGSYLLFADPVQNPDFLHQFYRLCRPSEDRQNLQHLPLPLLVKPLLQKPPRHQPRSTFLGLHKTPRPRRELELNVLHLGQCQSSKHTSLH